ncbi:MAG TPA: aminotransferase class I/II-fold pyridoxal phosphate-dependent enzyme [Candidatus Dormibacteraeota bacterium]|nr:aminotransferase class I/II-fold pyridoxal phosphate-dependent enzyme [Candidatus Dormibacteraeota bacterium]
MLKPGGGDPLSLVELARKRIAEGEGKSEFSYPVDRCAIAGAAAALADEEHHRRIVDGVRGERARLSARLAAAGWDLTDSHANFVFARPPGGDAPGVLARLRERRILVRHFDGDHADRLRITVGAPGENDRLLDALGI